MIYAYTRVSTNDQAADFKSSLDDQEATIRRRITKPIDRIFCDPGVSGAVHLNFRPAGKEMVAALKPGDVIVASKLDRLFRSARDALVTVEDLKDRGVDVILTDMGDEPVTQNGPSKMFFTMLAAFADFERGRLKERMADGRAGKKKRGGHIGGSAPYGYRVEGNGAAASLVEEPKEQAIIEAMRKYREDGFSYEMVAHYINASGHANRKGKPFSRTQVHRILTRKMV